MLIMSTCPVRYKGQNCSTSPALAVTSTSVSSAQTSNAGHPCELTKVCLQLPNADRATMLQAQTLQRSKHPTNRGNYLHTCCIGKFPYLLEARRVFAGQSLHAGFGIFLLGRGSITTYHKWVGLARGSYAASPVFCAAPQLLHCKTPIMVNGAFLALELVTWFCK